MKEPKPYQNRDNNPNNAIGISKRGVTEQDEAYIESYVSGDRMYINQMLRGNSNVYADADDRSMIKALDRVTNSTLNEQTLYRSVDASAIFGNISDIEYESLVSHVVYGDNQRLIVNEAKTLLSKATGTRIDKGFFSTTKDERIASEWGGYTGSRHPIVLKVHVPKGTKGRDLSKWDVKGAEQKEVLLARGRKYKVGRVYGKNGNVYVDVTIV